jgi:hypothetical protein
MYQIGWDMIQTSPDQAMTMNLNVWCLPCFLADTETLGSASLFQLDFHISDASGYLTLAASRDWIS